MTFLYVGVDVGKQHHHITVIDQDGVVVSSQQVVNDQAHLQPVIKSICHKRRNIRWAVDICTGPAELLIALLHARKIDLRFLNGALAARAAPIFNGERKSDARDALVIAQAMRIREDLPSIRPVDPIQATLSVLVHRRQDLVRERVRTIMRMQSLVISISPALGQVLDLTLRGPVILLTRWQTPAAIRAVTPEKIRRYLLEHRIPNAGPLSKAVTAAAAEQTVRVAAEADRAEVLADLARTLHAINIQIGALEARLAQTLPHHPLAEIVTSMPGLGVVLASEFLAIAGNPADYTTPARLASHAGFAPVNRDSGRVQGNLHRPRAFHRVLRRVFVLSSLAAIRHCPISNTYYRRKRAEGKTHRQAIGALARRRITVLWTMIQNRQVFGQRIPAPVTTG